MKKVFKFILFLAFLNTGVLLTNASTGIPSMSAGPSPSLIAPNRPIYQPNSILNVQSGIQANQNSLNNQHTPQEHVIHQGAVPNYAPNPLYPNGPHFIPRVYGWSNYNNDKQVQTTINNTYNYYPEAPKPKEEKVKENPPQKVKTQAQLDKEEREALRKKYSNILSNKTMSNSKMCTTMAGYYKDASYEELDRVLNRILRLNCNISKLRP